MRDLLGKYNRNRIIIWGIIGICVAVYFIIHLINDSLAQSKFNQNTVTNKTSEYNFYETNYSVISDNKISQSTNTNNTNIIKDFIEYCNDGNVEEAYSLLSDECKETLYPSLEIFVKNYYNNNFKDNKTYNLQLWIEDDIKYTYRIELMSDILSTGGKYNIKKVDYYTIIKDGEDLKLNIDGFVTKEMLNISNENEETKINVKSIEKYIDTSFFNIEVFNKTSNNLLLDKGKKGDSVYAIDSNKNTYASFLFEAEENDLIIEKNNKKEFKIKFLKTYDEKVDFTNLIFSDIVINYGKENEKENQKLEIELVK